MRPLLRNDARIWVEFTSALRNVTRQYRRSLFGISAVAFGVIALLLSAGFIEWIFWAAREGNIQTGLGHIQLVRSGYLEKGAADPFQYLMPEDSDIIRDVVRNPAVRAVAPRLAFSGLISHGESTISFIGDGVNPESDAKVNQRLPIPSGQNLSSSDPAGIVLGTGLARNLGVKVGDTVVLLASTAAGSINGIECTVRGLFNTTSKAYDDSALRVPLPVAQKLLRVSGVHRWVLMLDETDHVDTVLHGLRTRLQGSGIEAVPWYQLATFYNKMVALMSSQMGVVKLIIAVIIVLSISNTMMMNVLERTAEIGTCLAIGRRPREILRQFVYEGLSVGVLGALVGIVVGTALAAFISAVGIPMPPPPGMSQGYSGEILINPGLVTTAIVLALSTTFLASVYPAWKASRMQIVDALRHNR